ncbi:hypothetical protein HO133_006700 [Letharia lupina]|uniref:Uncharacterized protein n=1 Tax=Letharia lupina TaxID=560253 RepID=A0A8H6C6C1_9LECA|nr:uncharacterized protein HO133_006700 [Letharia lupina]KAF6217598.1 hypothetical protein HO133_006700 [Letharia lupina]
MAIKYRAAEMSISIDQVPADDPNLSVPGEIAAPGQSSVPTAFVTDAPAFATKSSTTLSTPSSTAATSSQSSTAAAPTQSAAAFKGGSGLSHGDIAAIVIPIALLAILIPILVLWYLDRKNRTAAEKRASHRSSNEAMLQKHSSIQKPPQPRGPKPARPERTPRRSVVDPPTPETRNSLGLFNFELSPPSTPGMGWMTPNPRFSIARALQLRRSQPSVVTSQPRTSRGESDRPRTGDSERSERRQTRTSIFDPPPPYVIDTASPKSASRFAPLERIGTLQHADRPHGPTMQPTMAPTLPAVAITNGALDVQQPRYTPRHTPRASSEILQLPDAYGRVHTRSPSPTLSMHNGSNLSRPFSYAAPERISDVSGLSDEPEPWRRMRESNGSSVISPIDSDESSTIHPHQVL